MVQHLCEGAGWLAAQAGRQVPGGWLLSAMGSRLMPPGVPLTPAHRLLFQHQASDQASGQDVFYSQSKANRCVACGEQGHYPRYRWVQQGSGGGSGDG